MKKFRSSYIFLLSGFSFLNPLSAELLFHWELDIDGSNSGSGSAYMDILSNASISTSCSVVGEGSLRVTSEGAPSDGGGKTSNPIRWNSFSDGDTRTISLWAKPSLTQEGNATIFSVGNDATGERFDIKNPSNFRIEIQGAGQSTGDSIQDDRWHHIAVVVPFADSEMKDLRFFLDGVEVTNGSNSTQEVNTATNSARLGDSVNGATDRDFDGFIDDVRIYDTALTDLEIQNLSLERRLIGCLEASVEEFDAAEPESVELSWDASSYSSLVISDDQGGTPTDVTSLSTDGVGTLTVNPTKKTTYTLSATPSSGGTAETRSITITVIPIFIEPLNIIAFELDDGEGSPYITIDNLVEGESYRLLGGSDLIDWTPLSPAITADSSGEATFTSTTIDILTANPTYFLQIQEQ